MDAMVKKVQQWLNKTYTGKDGYTPISEDGTTGWGTTNALLVALQIEENIPSWAIADEIKNKSFGFRGMTVAKCPKIGFGYANPENMVMILQGAFWCKGINPYAFDGKFTEATAAAIKKLQGDAGIAQTGVAYVLEFKALLSMDQYSLIESGNPGIRQIQQTLNSRYAEGRGELIPCDGIYGAGLNKALVYALQRLEGFTVDICNHANGYFGNGTADKCPVLAYGSTKKEFVELLQWCLFCNKSFVGEFTGIFDGVTKEAVSYFQRELELPGTIGVADINVWESLLISCGNKNRGSKACDTATTLSYEAAKELKANGYDVVGRYLTNKYAMTPEEMENIFKAGLDIFAIYEYGSTLNYYSESGRGIKDGEAARNAALELGIPEGTVLYFAIDYDMEDYQVTSIVMPYFNDINSVIAPYKVGVYGSRNICSRVSENGLAVSSFVLDMSTGYSGNLGYTMPSNWNFDQFAGATVGGVGIDKDGYKPTSSHAITFRKANPIQGKGEQAELNIVNNIVNTTLAINPNVDLFNTPAKNINGNAIVTITLNVGEKIGNYDGQINITRDRVTGKSSLSVEYSNSFVDVESGNFFKKGIKNLIIGSAFAQVSKQFNLLGVDTIYFKVNPLTRTVIFELDLEFKGLLQTDTKIRLYITIQFVDRDEDEDETVTISEYTKEIFESLTNLLLINANKDWVEIDKINTMYIESMVKIPNSESDLGEFLNVFEGLGIGEITGDPLPEGTIEIIG